MTTKMTGAVRKDGGWVLIGTQEASNSASLIQTGLSSDYDTYVVGVSNVRPTVDAQTLGFWMGDSSGIDTGSTDYTSIRQRYQEGSTSISITNALDTDFCQISQAAGTGSDEGLSCMFWILNPGDAGVRNTMYGYYVQYSATPELRGGHVYAMREAVITLDRIQITFYSGNIASGRMTVWGISHE